MTISEREREQIDYNRKIVELERRVEALEASVDYGAPDNTNEECRTHRCTYYLHYLVYGGPELAHEAYHQAEKQCAYWQDKQMDWLKKHEHDGLEMPESLERQCRTWEARVRA